jgi:hypothetical protein
MVIFWISEEKKPEHRDHMDRVHILSEFSSYCIVLKSSHRHWPYVANEQCR